MHDILLIVMSYVALPISCCLLAILLFPFPAVIQRLVVNFDIAIDRITGIRFMNALVVSSTVFVAIYGYLLYNLDMSGKNEVSVEVRN
jgi:hypothetical protein